MTNIKPQTALMGLETPATILAWSVATFGPRTARQIATRASREVNELMTAILSGGTLESIHEELADCAIMLWQVAALSGIPHRPEIVQTDALRVVGRELLALRFQRRLTVFLEETYMSSDEVAATVFRDVLRILEALIFVYGVSITEFVDTKMGINREREWLKLSDGNYQHAVVGLHTAAEVAQ